MTDIQRHMSAEISLKHGGDFPYDRPDDWGNGDCDPLPPTDWAHAAARGVIAELSDRHTIKRGFEGVEEAVRKEIVDALAAIIRLAGAS
jgi:hypothetical protein